MVTPEQFRIRWHDSGREPQCAPNPQFPEGIALDLSQGRTPTCETPLPYPARRCGHYEIVCRTCGLRVACTTAGRPDDPCAIRLACKPHGALGEATP
jgi:hypothetical protein